jgi:tetratricopeptide (TPR) repeat protein
MLNNKKIFQEALKLHQTGNLADASVLYNKILEEQPDNFDTISLLGTLNLQTGNLDAACLLLKKSVKLKPNNALAHNNLGSVFQSSGRYKEAITSYKQAITLNPDYDEAYYNLGNAYQAVNQLENAIASYKQAIALNPNDADIYSNLSNALRKSKKPEEALMNYRQAIILMPLNAEMHNNLGAALQEQGMFDEAILSCRQAITLNPKLAKAHNNLGAALKKQHKLEDAIKCFNRAIELKPEYAEAYYNLGAALHTSSRFDEAIDAFKKAITIKPHYAKAHYNLGNTLKELNNFEESIISYKQAITIKQDYIMAHNNLGTILQEQGKIDEAEECYSRAIELKPDYADAHLNKALTALLNGNLKNGWQEYEWRLRTKNYALRNFNHPMWDGKPLNDKTILIHTEQGFGDTIQFIRYLPMIQAQGAGVIFECLPNLICLLKNGTGFDKIIEKKSSGELSEEFDIHVPLLSLPGLFDTTLDSIPSDVPYIAADPCLIDQWRIRLNDGHKYKIGIVWAGNPNHKKDHNRSCSLSDFATLAEIPESSIYSLQKGPATVEVDKWPGSEEIINLDNEIHDFADTAAIIANLDLVISVDTVVAHLAGAIGKPVWTLLPFVPDWRWLLNRNDSPWYPNMRLFRQARPNDWAGVFKQVKHTLLQEADNFRSRSTVSQKLSKSEMEGVLVAGESK